jgi:conjugative relaxase-like TrwC/TraI family protein
VTATLHALGCGSAAGTYYTDDPNREARPKCRDNYYTRDGGGTWWTTGNSIVRHGAPVDKETFRDLCGGFDPRTGKALVRGAGERHRAGWDITFSTPKSFAILWAAGTAEQRALLEKIQNAAVDQALQFIIDEGLVEVRLGAGGRVRQAPAEILVAKFPHFTSREGDMACHVHSVLLNAARSANGKSKYLTVEPRKAYDWQLVLGSAFRAALAAQLVADLGFSLRPAGRDQFEIAGIPERMIEHFSKRARQIRAHTGPDASAAQKEVAALATRRAKASVPTGAELEKRWNKELAAFEIDPWKVALEAGRSPCRRQAIEIDYDFDPPEIAGDTSVALAASALLRTESVLTRKGLLHRSFVEASMKGKAIETVYGEISDLEAKQKLVRLDQHKASQHWTTAEIAAEEASLLRLVQERQRGSWFRPEAVEAALQAAPYLSDEQRRAIRHATSCEPTCILESGAGTGKTTLIRGVVDAARKSGLKKIIGLTPSWVAADELARSAGIEAMAIARFRHEIATGQRFVPDDNTLIIIDEAGMVGVRDMAAIFEAATRSTAAGETRSDCSPILLCGDRRQLASVAGGSALKAVSDLIERKATLTGVRRQTVDWQRAASVAMAQGDSEAGLRVYAEHGRVDLVAGREAAQAHTIEAWRELRQSYGDDVLVVTRRNRDAVALNLLARAILRNEGLIRGEEITLPSVDRDGDKAPLPLAIGDRIRFGETLHQHRIRNGTRGRIEGYAKRSGGSVRLAIRLEDGRLIEDAWSGFAQKRRRRHAGIPKIVHAVAGSVYSVQGRTSLATVHYIGSATDAREIYVANTRHRHDLRIVAEVDRLESACRARQEDARMAPTRLLLLERLFQEARRYHEKANVIDHVEDRIRFIASGQAELPRPQGRLNIGVAAEAARRVELAARYIGAQGRGFTVRLRQLAMSVLSDRRMPESVKTVIGKVRSWTHPNGIRRPYDRDLVVHEYGR